MNCAIYQIKNKLDGKIYIGSAVNPKKRWQKHLRELKKNKHHSILLQRAFDKYKEENFEFSIIEDKIEIDALLAREQHYLDSLQSYMPEIGYNICKVAGNTSGRKTTEEAKEKMRKAQAGVQRFYNRALTKEQEEEFVSLVNSGVTLKELANKFSCNERTLGDYCKRNNILANGAKRKLSPEIAREIREMNKEGKRPKEISEMFGVHFTAVYRIIRNESWTE